MALIDCPECGTEVSDKAEKCLKCAYPITNSRANNVDSNSSSKNETSVIVKSKEGCFLQTLNTGCLIIAIVIIIFILLAVIR